MFNDVWSLIIEVYNGQYSDGADRLYRRLKNVVNIKSMLRGITFKTDLQYIDALVCSWLISVDCKGNGMRIPIKANQGIMKGYSELSKNRIISAYSLDGMSVAVHKDYKAYIAFNRIFIVHNKIRKYDFVPKYIYGVKYNQEVYGVSDKMFLPFRVAIENLCNNGKYTDWLKNYFDVNMKDYVDSTAFGEGDLEREIILDSVVELAEQNDCKEDVDYVCKEDYLYVNNVIYKLPRDITNVDVIRYITFEKRFLYISYINSSIHISGAGVIDTAHNILYYGQTGGIAHLVTVTSSDAKRKLVL